MCGRRQAAGGRVEMRHAHLLQHVVGGEGSVALALDLGSDLQQLERERCVGVGVRVRVRVRVRVGVRVGVRMGVRAMAMARARARAS